MWGRLGAIRAFPFAVYVATWLVVSNGTLGRMGTQALPSESCIRAPLRGGQHRMFMVHLVMLVFGLAIAVYVIAVALALLFDATFRLAARQGHHLPWRPVWRFGGRARIGTGKSF